MAVQGLQSWPMYQQSLFYIGSVSTVIKASFGWEDGLAFIQYTHNILK